MSRKSVKFGSFLRDHIDDRDVFRKWLQLGMAFGELQKKAFSRQRSTAIC